MLLVWVRDFLADLTNEMKYRLFTHLKRANWQKSSEISWNLLLGASIPYGEVKVLVLLKCWWGASWGIRGGSAVVVWFGWWLPVGLARQRVRYLLFHCGLGSTLVVVGMIGVVFGSVWGACGTIEWAVGGRFCPTLKITLRRTNLIYKKEGRWFEAVRRLLGTEQNYCQE